MKVQLFAAILGFLLIISPAFALNITLSTDKEKLFLGETFTMKGKIAFDDGNSGTFDYRAAVVAPKRVIICDSNKTKTAADGTFTLVCKTPTKEEAVALGIPAASDRAIIPLRPGVAVFDSAKNETVKKHGRAVLAINPDKYKARFNGIFSDIDNFIKKSDSIVSECNKISERAQKFNVTSIVDKCQTLKDKLSSLIQDAQNISAQALELSKNLNATNLEDFKYGLSIIKDDMKEFRNEIKDLREQVKAIRWETLKEVREVKREAGKEIREEKKEERKEIKESANETRKEIKEEIKSKREELKERIKKIRDKTESEGSR